MSCSNLTVVQIFEVHKNFRKKCAHEKSFFFGHLVRCPKKNLRKHSIPKNHVLHHSGLWVTDDVHCILLPPEGLAVGEEVKVVPSSLRGKKVRRCGTTLRIRTCWNSTTPDYLLLQVFQKKVVDNVVPVLTENTTRSLRL